MPGLPIRGRVRKNLLDQIAIDRAKMPCSKACPQLQERRIYHSVDRIPRDSSYIQECVCPVL
jgi:hypothetical protein